MNIATQTAQSVETLLAKWGLDQGQSRDLFDPPQAARARLAATRCASFEELLRHVRECKPQAGWIMLPSEVRVHLAESDPLPDAAPWLAAEFALPGKAGITVRHDGHDFVLTHVEELDADADEGQPALCTEVFHRVAPANPVLDRLGKMRYRVLHLHAEPEGWRPAIAMFRGFDPATEQGP